MSNIQHLERWVDVVNHVAVITLALSALFGASSIYLGRKLSKAERAQSAAEMRFAQVKIAETDASAAKANREAARANMETAALATEARSKQAELTVEQQKLAKAHRQLADAERKRAEAQLVLEKTLEEVRNRQAPRTLSADQRTHLMRLLQAIRAKGEVDVQCVLGNDESYAFATEIKGLLKAAAWPVGKDSVIQAVYSSGNPKGQLIAVHSAKGASKYAAALQQAFGKAGLTLDGAEDAKLPEGKVLVVIGVKP